MPCVARKTNKTHHLLLDPSVLVIIHVSVAFVTHQHPRKKFCTLFASRAWATCANICLDFCTKP